MSLGRSWAGCPVNSSGSLGTKCGLSPVHAAFVQEGSPYVGEDARLVTHCVTGALCLGPFRSVFMTLIPGVSEWEWN